MSKLVVIIDGKEIDYEKADIAVSMDYVNFSDVFDISVPTNEIITVTIETKKEPEND